MHYETIVFDLDGTISDPSIGIVRCTNFSLQAMGLEKVEPEKVRSLIGVPLQDMLRQCAGEVRNDKLEQLICKYRERYASLGYAENKLYEGIPELLTELGDRGIRLGICTSKRRDFAVQILSMFDLCSHFSFVDGGDIGVEKSDQLARLVQSGMHPETTIMVGDRAVDVLAARHNAIVSVGVSWGFGTQQELANARPDFLADTPCDVAQLIR